MKFTFFKRKRKNVFIDPFSLSIDDYFKMQNELRDIPDGPSRNIETIMTMLKYVDSGLNDIGDAPAGDAVKVLSQISVSTDELASGWPDLPGHKVFKKMSELSVAQFIDLQMSLPKAETNPEYLLSVFIIPKGHKYNEGYDTEEHIKWLRHNVSIGHSNYIINFFLKWYLKSTRRTLLSFKVKTVLTRVPKEQKEMKQKTIAAIDAMLAQIKYIRGFA